MTLNSSGPISLGGSTTGQSINLELGFSATALASINSTSFRTLAGVASGAISLSNFYGKSNVSYFFATFKPSASPYSSGHFASGSYTYILGTNTNYSAYIWKINNSGSLSTKQTVTSGYQIASNANYGKACFTVDSSGNIFSIYLGGPYFTGITSSLTFNFSKNYAFTNPYNGQSVQGLYIQGSPVFDGTYIYALAYVATAFGCCCAQYPTVLRFDTSGTPANAAGPVSGVFNSNINLATAMASDSSYNLYVAVNGNAGVYKFIPSSNSIPWYWPTIGNLVPYGINVNSAGTLLGIVNGSGFFLSNIASTTASTAPTLIYSVNVSGLNYTLSPSVVFDSSNNVYFCITISTGGTYGFVVFKVNSSGTLQWQRLFETKLSGGSSATATSLVATCTGTSLNLSYSTITNSGALGYIQYPTDGSKTGTYTTSDGGIVISASSYTITSVSLGFTAGGASETVLLKTPPVQSTSTGSNSTLSSTDSFVTL